MWDEITYPFPNFNGVAEQSHPTATRYMRYDECIHVEVKVKPC